MKIRTLLLGSVVLGGLSTAGYAADLGVVTSLDVCDELGLSGLTISSDNNCLVITGSVKFEYKFGSYEISGVGGAPIAQYADPAGVDQYPTISYDDDELDSKVDIDAWLKFVATADSDFGPATATIKLISENNTGTVDGTVGIDEAWVGIGDTTVLMAGYKSSIFNTGDDEPLNYLGLFYSSSIDDYSGNGPGVGSIRDGGIDPPGGADPTIIGDSAVIQVVSNLGNGVSIAGGLEQLGDYSGVVTGVGTLTYAGDGIAAHISGAMQSEDPLFGGSNPWAVHAGFKGTWDPITVVGAFAADDGGGDTFWDALGSISAKLDIFTLAASVEATSEDEFGAGASLSAEVSEGVTLNLGGRYFANTDTDEELYQLEAGISVAVAETLTATAAVGVVNSTYGIVPPGYETVYYGKAGLAWAPGGGFTASVDGEINSESAWKITTKAAKTIE